MPALLLAEKAAPFILQVNASWGVALPDFLQDPKDKMNINSIK
jgi:hypothetical protein